MTKRRELVIYAYRRGFRVADDGTAFGLRGKPVGYNDVNGYRSVSIRHPKYGVCNLSVHKLAAYQHFGNNAFAKGIHVRHLDNDGCNNAKTNLALGTSTDNELDKPPEYRVSNALNAAKSTRKMTKSALRQLKADRYKRGMKYSELSVKYGIVKSTISYILNSKTYRTF